MSRRLGDGITTLAGSWWFLLIHAVWWAAWLGIGVEPFPYGLLTMILSLEVIVLSTVIMISQNRQAEKDREMARRDDGELALLLKINRAQLTLLRRMAERP